MAGDVKGGLLEFTYRNDVHDGSGELIHSLPFSQVVEIIPAS